MDGTALDMITVPIHLFKNFPLTRMLRKHGCGISFFLVLFLVHVKYTCCSQSWKACFIFVDVVEIRTWHTSIDIYHYSHQRFMSLVAHRLNQLNYALFLLIVYLLWHVFLCMFFFGFFHMHFFSKRQADENKRRLPISTYLCTLFLSISPNLVIWWE